MNTARWIFLLICSILYTSGWWNVGYKLGGYDINPGLFGASMVSVLIGSIVILAASVLLIADNWNKDKKG